MTAKCNLRTKLLSSSSGGRYAKRTNVVVHRPSPLVNWVELDLGFFLLATSLLLLPPDIQHPRSFSHPSSLRIYTWGECCHPAFADVEQKKEI